MGRDPVIGEDRVGGIDPVAVVEHHHADPLATECSCDYGNLDLGLGGDRLALGNVGNARRLESVVGGGLWVGLEGGGSNHHHRRGGLGCRVRRGGGVGALATQVAINQRLARLMHESGGGECAERTKCHVMNVDAEWWCDPRHVRPALIDLHADRHRGEDDPESGAKPLLKDDEHGEDGSESDQELVKGP